MEVVIVLALLSAFNAQIYATSRLMYSFSQERNAPRWFRKTNAQKVPYRAVWCSLFFAFVSVALQVWGPEDLIKILFNAVGGTLLVIWMVIVLSEIKLRPTFERDGSLSVRMWGYPVLPWLTFLALIALMVLMLFDEGARLQVITVAVAFVVLSLIGLALQKTQGPQEAEDSAGTAASTTTATNTTTAADSDSTT